MTKFINKTVITAGASVAALCFAVNATAETAYEDMLAKLATGDNRRSSAKNFETISGVETAPNVHAWLSSASGTCLYWTCMNGDCSIHSVDPTLTYSEGTYTLSFTNNVSVLGAVVGFSYTLSDYTKAQPGLTLPIRFQSRLRLVFQG